MTNRKAFKVSTSTALKKKKDMVGVNSHESCMNLYGGSPINHHTTRHHVMINKQNRDAVTELLRTFVITWELHTSWALDRLGSWWGTISYIVSIISAGFSKDRQDA